MIMIKYNKIKYDCFIVFSICISLKFVFVILLKLLFINNFQIVSFKIFAVSYCYPIFYLYDFF